MIHYWISQLHFLITQPTCEGIKITQRYISYRQVNFDTVSFAIYQVQMIGKVYIHKWNYHLLYLQHEPLLNWMISLKCELFLIGPLCDSCRGSHALVARLLPIYTDRLAIWGVPLAEYDLLTLLEHLMSLSFFLFLFLLWEFTLLALLFFYVKSLQSLYSPCYSIRYIVCVDRLCVLPSRSDHALGFIRIWFVPLQMLRYHFLAISILQRWHQVRQ